MTVMGGGVDKTRETAAVERLGCDSLLLLLLKRASLLGGDRRRQLSDVIRDPAAGDERSGGAGRRPEPSRRRFNKELMTVMIHKRRHLYWEAMIAVDWSKSNPDIDNRSQYKCMI